PGAPSPEGGGGGELDGVCRLSATEPSTSPDRSRRPAPSSSSSPGTFWLGSASRPPATAEGQNAALQSTTLSPGSAKATALPVLPRAVARCSLYGGEPARSYVSVRAGSGACPTRG